MIKRMGVAACLVTVAAYAAIMGSATALVLIKDDFGGQIEEYLDKYERLRVAGEQVGVDGVCSSACTLVLGIIPADRICVTARARFGFHSAWRWTARARTVESLEGNRFLLSIYPAKVRDWLTGHGGLGRETLYLLGSDLAKMYQPCRREVSRR
jgi:hypothetical protein